MNGEPVGTTKGPGEKPHEYVFISPDRGGALKNGEFVYYELRTDDATRQVMGRVSGRMPVRLYPDNLLADPVVPPDRVAAALGYDGAEYELFEIVVSILGYYDEKLKTFVNPRIAPRSGWPIYLAPSEELAQIVNKCVPGDLGSAHVGWLLSRPSGEVPVVLAAREFTSTHMAIIASTGAGKSYLASVIVEELMKPANKACVLIVDPHGEYDTLAEMVDKPEFRQDGLLPAYLPRVQVMRPEQVKVRVSSLTLGDLRYLLPEMTDRMDALLGKAYRALTKDKGDKWTPADLEAKIRSIAAAKDQEDEGLDLSSTAGALGWRLDKMVSDSRIFHDYSHLDLRDIFKPGQCTVLQLNEIDRREQQVIVSVLLRRLYHARMETDRMLVTDRADERFLPYPAFVLLEEAHHFAPGGEGAGVVSAQILKQILSEGRKFGIGIGLISQRPGKLDADVLSQCMTQFIMRIVNPIDQNTIASAIESVGRDLLDELPALSKGQVVVAGSSLNTPVLCQVRPRLTRHGGEDKDAPKEWNEYFSKDAVERREAEQSAYRPSPPRGSKIYRLPDKRP